MKRRMMTAALATAMLVSIISGCGNSAYKEAYDAFQQQVKDEAEKMQAEMDKQAGEIPDDKAPEGNEQAETQQEQAGNDSQTEGQDATSEEPEPEGQGDGEEGSGEDEPFVEKYKRDIVVSSEMLLKRFISGYKIPLATQLWTIAPFDEEGAVAATTAVTNESSGETLNAFVVLTPILDGEKMTGATPHFVMVGGTIYGDDGYCDDFMTNLQEAMDNLEE
ncbi:MAG: hypothetical protein IJS41_03700 [Clostridia bacterium]|nr:hypothetical protein [Clostridia bacterium]